MVQGGGATRLVLVAVLCVAAACAPRAELNPAVPAPPDARVERIYLATNRLLPAPLRATSGRSAHLSYQALDIAVPGNHEPGRVEYSARAPGPAASFALTGQEVLPGLAALQGAVRNAPGSDEDVVVFVHGFNVNMAEAVYRHAQIAHDYGLRGPQVTFAWPSAAEPLAYAYDRDSISISRDALEAVLTGLARTGRRVLLIAHSMGSQLAVETLRQMSLGGNRAALRRISGVILLAPDIDIDLFESQLARIVPKPDPFLVFVSRRDQVLRLSARLTGQTERLGSVRDIERLRGLGVSVVDLSALDGQGDFNHFVAATSPTAIALLRGLAGSDLRIRTGQPTAIDLAGAMLGIRGAAADAAP